MQVCSVLGFKREVEFDGYAWRTCGVDDLVGEAERPADVERPEVHVGGDELSSVVWPEQVRVAPIAGVRVAQIGHGAHRAGHEVVRAPRPVEP